MEKTQIIRFFSPWESHTIKFLGLYVNYRFCWSGHIDVLCRKLFSSVATYGLLVWGGGGVSLSWAGFSTCRGDALERWKGWAVATVVNPLLENLQFLPCPIYICIFVLFMCAITCFLLVKMLCIITMIQGTRSVCRPHFTDCKW